MKSAFALLSALLLLDTHPALALRSRLEKWIARMLRLGVPGENPAPLIPGGGRIVFAGHSFFVPVARTFNRLAEGRYPNHVSVSPVMAGGPTGSPQNLWLDAENRDAILAALGEDPPPDVLALTAGLDTVVEHYQTWLDEAQLYNPEIVLFIGLPFVKEGATTPLLQYARSVKEGLAHFKAMVEQLREDNPGSNIYVVEHASVAVAMRHMFDAGRLDGDVPDGILCADKDRCLFRDADPGHPGSMMYHLAALTWLHFLYGMDPAAHRPSDLFSRDYSEDVVRDVATISINANKASGWNDGFL